MRKTVIPIITLYMFIGCGSMTKGKAAAESAVTRFHQQLNADADNQIKLTAEGGVNSDVFPRSTRFDFQSPIFVRLSPFSLPSLLHTARFAPPRAAGNDFPKADKQ